MYCELIKLIKFWPCGKRWLTTNFLSTALWVTFDQDENIMAVTHRVHYGTSHNGAFPGVGTHNCTVLYNYPSEDYNI